MPDTLGLDPYLNIDSNATIELIGSGVLRHCGLGRARSNEGRSCMLFKSAQFLFAFLPGALRHISFVGWFGNGERRALEFAKRAERWSGEFVEALLPY
jgi:hypothetical protein